MKRINFKWVIPIVLCYLVIGFLVYTIFRFPDITWVRNVCTISILTTVILTMVFVLGLDNDKTEVQK